MHTLTLELGERSYPITIGKGLLGQGELLTRHIAGSRAAVQATITANGGDCADCHGTYIADFFTGHQVKDHSSKVAMATPECSGCHTTFGDTTNSTDPMIHDSCTTCHDTDGVLTGSAAGNFEPNDCLDSSARKRR